MHEYALFCLFVNTIILPLIVDVYFFGVKKKRKSNKVKKEKISFFYKNEVHEWDKVEHLRMRVL